MNYLDLLASKVYQAAHPETTPHDFNLPLYRLYAVLVLAKGQQVTAEDVHNAWSAWASEHALQNQNIIPFKELSSHTQSKDHLYVQAIHDVARHIYSNDEK